MGDYVEEMLEVKDFAHEILASLDDENVGDIISLSDIYELSYALKASND